MLQNNDEADAYNNRRILQNPYEDDFNEVNLSFSSIILYLYVWN